MALNNNHCKNIIIANCNRPPSGNADNFVKTLEQKLLRIDCIKNDIFITGDINVDLGDVVCNTAKKFKTTMVQLGFTQLIKETTRYGQNKNSILDVIYTNSAFISRAGVCNVNISDHQMIYCTRKKIHNKRQSVNFKGRSYRNFDERQFITNFLNLDWDDFDNEDDPDILWDIYENKIRVIMDPMCPFKHFKIAKDRDPWVSDDLIDEIKQKDYLLKKAKK